MSLPSFLQEETSSSTSNLRIRARKHHSITSVQIVNGESSTRPFLHTSSKPHVAVPSFEGLINSTPFQKKSSDQFSVKIIDCRFAYKSFSCGNSPVKIDAIVSKTFTFDAFSPKSILKSNNDSRFSGERRKERNSSMSPKRTLTFKSTF